MRDGKLTFAVSAPSVYSIIAPSCFDLATTFDPTAGTAPEESALLGATTGGINFTAVPSFTDFGEDIDNCPKNMKELKQIESWEVKLSGTYVSASAENAKSMFGAADVTTTSKVSKITPRNDLKDSDFTDLWLLCDYSDKHGTTKGGFCAIHMLNTLSTGGFSLQTGDKEKGQMSFEYTAHYLSLIHIFTTTSYKNSQARLDKEIMRFVGGEINRKKQTKRRK